MIQAKTEGIQRGLTLEVRRAFMKLPLEERRRQMSEQAAQMVDDYQEPSEVGERETWQGGDIVECP